MPNGQGGVRVKTGKLWIALLCAACILGGVLLTGPAMPAEQTEALVKKIRPMLEDAPADEVAIEV